jgi:hypothetical protein
VFIDLGVFEGNIFSANPAALDAGVWGIHHDCSPAFRFLSVSFSFFCRSRQLLLCLHLPGVALLVHRAAVFVDFAGFE